MADLKLQLEEEKRLGDVVNSRLQSEIDRSMKLEEEIFILRKYLEKEK
jgi:hypothetical protein